MYYVLHVKIAAEKIIDFPSLLSRIKERIMFTVIYIFFLEFSFHATYIISILFYFRRRYMYQEIIRIYLTSHTYYE